MRATLTRRLRIAIGGVMIETLIALPAIAAESVSDIAARKIGEAMAL
jgi:hypothetical protein